MTPAPEPNRLTLAVLDWLLAGLGFVFVARTALRHLAAGFKLRRHHED